MDTLGISPWCWAVGGQELPDEHRLRPSVYGKVFDVAGRAERKNAVSTSPSWCAPPGQGAHRCNLWEFQPDVVVVPLLRRLPLAGYIDGGHLPGAAHRYPDRLHPCNPFWQGASMNAFVTQQPADLPAGQAGIDPAITAPWAFRSTPKFSQVIDPVPGPKPSWASSRVPTVLVMGGSMGFWQRGGRDLEAGHDAAQFPDSGGVQLNAPEKSARSTPWSPASA